MAEILLEALEEVFGEVSIAEDGLARVVVAEFGGGAEAVKPDACLRQAGFVSAFKSKS